MRAATKLDAVRLDHKAILEATPRDLELIGEAARTCLELYIATHARAEHPGSEASDKLAVAILGADLPSDEDAHRARDLQFELFMLGFMNAAGTACRLAEPPDLICAYRDGEAGIAAKRLWSLEQAKRRLSDGADQVERAGLPGFIAVNAQEYLTGFGEIQSVEEATPRYQERLARLHGQLGYLKTKPHVLGLLVAGTTFEWVRTEGQVPRLAVSSFYDFQAITDDSHKADEVKRFTDAQMEQFGRWMHANM